VTLPVAEGLRRDGTADGGEEAESAERARTA
jgi:hypothetical protein